MVLAPNPCQIFRLAASQCFTSSYYLYDCCGPLLERKTIIIPKRNQSCAGYIAISFSLQKPSGTLTTGGFLPRHVHLEIAKQLLLMGYDRTRYPYNWQTR